jgi:two-component system, sensor histidine kinase LadS
MLHGCMGLLLSWGSPVLARTVLDLDTRNQPVALADWGDYWIDPTGQLGPENVAADPTHAWQPTSAGTIYPLEAGNSAWVRINVPPAPDGERWYLEVPHSGIDRASLYTLDGAGRWNEQRAGDLTAVSSWPVPHRYPLLPIALSAEVPTQYLLRLESNHPIGMSLRFVSESVHSFTEQRVSLLLGIFFGLAGLAALLSAISAVSLRDPAYGWCAMLVSFLSLTAAAITGIGGLHLWPHWTQINTLSAWVLPLLTAATGPPFISAVTAMPERSATIHRTLIAGSVIGLMCAIAMIWVPPNARGALLIVPCLVLPSLGTLALLWAHRHGDRFAGWVALAYLPLLAAVGWSLSPVLGWIPVGFFTMHGLQIAIALHLPVLLIVLMLRSQHRRENSRRIQGLDRVDPATGLINMPVFVERLQRMMARSERLRQQSAVLMIDLVNAEQIQRDFGRKAANELPLRVAGRLLTIAREIDSAARLGERRFGLLVEGPFSAQDAAALGPRVIARCLMAYPGLHVECVAQVRIAYATVPYADADAHSLVSQLEVRLATAPTHTRRAVFMLHEGAIGSPPPGGNKPAAPLAV